MGGGGLESEVGCESREKFSSGRASSWTSLIWSKMGWGLSTNPMVPRPVENRQVCPKLLSSLLSWLSGPRHIYAIFPTLLNLRPDILMRKQFKRMIQILTVAKQIIAKAWKSPSLAVAEVTQSKPHTDARKNESYRQQTDLQVWLNLASLDQTSLAARHWRDGPYAVVAVHFIIRISCRAQDQVTTGNSRCSSFFLPFTFSSTLLHFPLAWLLLISPMLAESLPLMGAILLRPSPPSYSRLHSQVGKKRHIQSIQLNHKKIKE